MKGMIMSDRGNNPAMPVLVNNVHYMGIRTAYAERDAVVREMANVIVCENWPNECDDGQIMTISEISTGWIWP